METKGIQAVLDSFIDNRVSTLASKHKLAIAVAVIIAPAALFYFLYFSPKSTEIIAQEDGVLQLQQELATIKVKASKLDEQKAMVAAMETKFKEASLVIPDTKEISSLLTNISTQGSGAGLDILSFVPESEISKEFYAEIPVALAVTGTYHNIGYFLDTVSKLPRIVNVAKVTLAAPKLTDGEMLIDAKLDLVTYKFIEPPATANATTAKK